MKFRSLFFAVWTAVVLISCGEKGYDPADWLTAQEQTDEVSRVIRYVGRAPENIPVTERFDKKYDKHYEGQFAAHRLDAYFVKDGTHYFLLSRIAPSNTVKRVATGGRYTLNDKGDMTEYEEVFRTWKAPDTTQIRKSIFLFDKMVKGESLEAYLTKNSWPNEYIEFPDDNVRYDKNERMWKGIPK